MQQARAVCLGQEDERWDDLHAQIKPCADYLVGKIKERAKILRATNLTQKSIGLGE
jgi:hypothetical protein